MQDPGVISPSSRRFRAVMVATLVAQLLLIVWALGPW